MRVVVLGTGTDVGKSFVTARLAAALHASGRRTLALKPIESGVAAGESGVTSATTTPGNTSTPNRFPSFVGAGTGGGSGASDEVVTGGGVRGKVTKVSDDEAEVEIAQGVRVRVVKSTLSQVLTKNAKPAND